ncbi:tRNA pseudouridine synthase Pus10 [Petromyzon marinus]|uniref:tRNA pseudouridine synthase Pus10 n=1 Tax=Petromyzon marinus TaxID=7757 RepID=UPI003F72329C
MALQQLPDGRWAPVVSMLLKGGCCPRCVLRLCRVVAPAVYQQPEMELLGQLEKLTSSTALEGSPHETSDGGDVDERPRKKMKTDNLQMGMEPDDVQCPLESDERRESNGSAESEKQEAADVNRVATKVSVCSVCLGVMQRLCEDPFIEEMCNKVRSSDYQFSSMLVSASFPPQLAVREHAAWLAIKENESARGAWSERGDGSGGGSGTGVLLKEAYKWVVYPALAKRFRVPVEGKSPFEVSLNLTHKETDGECRFLASACPDCFKPSKNKQSLFSRAAVSKALEKIPDNQFRRNFPWPLPPPTRTCVCTDIACTHGPVFVAGRYNKYSRTLPQTPWVIDGERKMESSVEELIANILVLAFNASGFNFSSSGREDVDVRTLGKGRPFAVELINPRRAALSPSQLRQLQKEINSSDKIAVRDLQIVSREAMAHMKEGEEEKTKSYSALVWSEKALVPGDLDFLRDIKDLRLEQTTPLRVLHRRPLAMRPRLIHTMRAELCNAHHFRLDLRTQAGTYIKEFVHGDFGRTVPNLGSLLGTQTDILELDVESVDVAWPPPLDDVDSPEQAEGV